MRRRILLEVGLAFAFATGVAATLYRLQSVPFIKANLHALVAAVFLLLPQALLRRREAHEGAALGDQDYGFRLRPLGRGLALFAITSAVVLPLFVGAFWLYHEVLCSFWPKLVSGSCVRFASPLWRLPPDFARLALAQLVVVALPEELFFRGYIQTRLDGLWTRRVRLWGAEVGWGLPLGALIFAAGHWLVTFEPQMWTRFFPGLLFGWMFARTRSVLAGTLFHAACNLLVDVLALTFLG